MGNMSYCRFENTAQDLQDCVRAIENRDVYDFSSYELNGFKKTNKTSRRNSKYGLRNSRNN